jgi:hypothetical protein
MEFRWDNNDGYKKLYYYQTSALQDDRADWYLTLREKDRKTAMLKLTVTVPDFFDAKLKPERMSLCRTSRGSMMSRSKCLEEVPATIEVNEDQTAYRSVPRPARANGGGLLAPHQAVQPQREADVSTQRLDPSSWRRPNVWLRRQLADRHGLTDKIVSSDRPDAKQPI